MKKEIFLFAIAFIITFLISEVFIRTTHLASVSYTDFYEDIGRARRQNFNYVFFNEGFGIGEFNEFRYSGEGIPPEKDSNTIRIILMGDSYVEALQVFDRHYFGNIAEQFLSERFSDTDFELLNFGRSGFDLANVYAYHKTFAENFNPDYILYFITRGDLKPKNEDPLRPKLQIQNDSLVVDFDFPEQELKLFETTKFFLQESAIVNMLNNGRKKAESIPVGSILLGKVYTWMQPAAGVSEEMEATETENYEINPVTQKIIQSIDPDRIIVFNRSFSDLPVEFEILCHDNNVRLYDLGQSLDSLRQTGQDPVAWPVTNKYGHWNHLGHRFVGEEVGRYLSGILKKEYVNNFE
ncbi:hypothetical protein [Marinilabilia rubra]|uniref:SGNH/GDSL hydrolase family protein n=1 Tax=Marinilabilia rubra TaxID=2162893 RepID=A0A2U2B436_9BACT|nr:hypothetical protein [Marinilabilia rubra]PWD97831.1 hypothetical protein DDZ16_18760 [Marinilabilia rubra]